LISVTGNISSDGITDTDSRPVEFIVYTPPPRQYITAKMGEGLTFARWPIFRPHKLKPAESNASGPPAKKIFPS
jgi:hypothetical protein